MTTDTASAHPFEQLSPDVVMAAVEQLGYQCSGHVFALGSYENRVYQIGLIGQDSPIIVKFYRPDRWTEAQIQEEHDFSFEAQEQDIPVVTPVKDNAGQSVFSYQGFLIAVFPRKGGYAPELDYQDNLAIMGRTLARLHNIGASKTFQHRPTLDVQSFGQETVDFVAEHHLPFEHKTSYLSVCNKIIEHAESTLKNAHNIRVHGDLHVGNIIMRDDMAHLVDFDDARMAPAIQDIWMLLSGNKNEQQAQLQKIIAAYTEFRDFPHHELHMIESLRALRMIHHSGWIARRWNDPAFPVAFPWFADFNYWTHHIQDLQTQLNVMQKN